MKTKKLLTTLVVFAVALAAMSTIIEAKRGGMGSGHGSGMGGHGGGHHRSVDAGFVPIEYYVDADGSWYPYNFAYGPLSWLSKFNITEEEGNEITTQCIIAFEQNAERLAEEVPTKIPEYWLTDEVQLKKEDFFIEYMPGLKKVDDKVVLQNSKILEDNNVNYSAFNNLLLYISQYNQCVYDLKEKKVEKIRIILHPNLLYIGFG